MIKIILTSDIHRGFSRNTSIIHERFFHSIKNENPDILIIAGDLITNQQKQLESLFKHLRGILPTLPILVCLGNHDFWETDKFNKKSPQRILDKHTLLFNKYNIQHVSTPLILDNVYMGGFDGWYWHHNPNTNDKACMPLGESFFEQLRGKVHTDLETLLQTNLEPYRAAICVTHFPPFTESEYYYPYCANKLYLEFISDKFDILCVGHSHRASDFIHNNCRVLNCGSDYDKPKYVSFSI